MKRHPSTHRPVHRPVPRRLAVVLPLLLLAQLGLVAAGVWPQLSARAVGEEIQLRVEPVDPIDPFRGAYVDLDYPDLRTQGRDASRGPASQEDSDEAGTVYVNLREDEGVWVADGWSRTRPEDGTYLRCDDRFWELRCGIESWFVPQDEAREIERAVADGTVVATVKVDGRGNAAIVGIIQG